MMDYYKLKVLNHKKVIMIIITIIVIIGGLFIYYFCFYQETYNDIIIENNSNLSHEDKVVSSDKIIVDIKGYVEKPGVYSFTKEEDARINDLILKAGGLKKDADTSIINLSRKLEDEMTIIIYSNKEVGDFVNNQNDLQKKLEICEEKLKNNACLENKISNNSLININTGTQEELMTLPGIGEAKANAIIKYRNEKSFTNIEELKNVEGIGDSLFENIKDSITI